MKDDKLVLPRYEREDDSSPGPFYVIKGHCLLCAVPLETAPENITWSAQTFRTVVGDNCPHHCRVERQPETPEELSNVIEAACESCMAAIRYCGTDPMIIEEFRKRDALDLCDAVDLPPN